MASNGRNIREQILGLLARKDYRPLDRIDIARKLGLTSAGRVALRKSLRELERAGAIARIRKNRYVLPAEADLVTGKLSIHQAGYGFLAPEMPGGSDVFIAAENIGTAMHGDRVVARISRDEPYGRIKGRREGRVIRILERAHDTIVGTLQRSRNFYYVVPDDPRFVHDIYVHRERGQPPGKRADLGDKVVMVLRNHGMLTCGRSVAEAFKLMHNLERSCRAQLAVQGANAEIVPLSASVARKTAGQYETFYDSIELNGVPDIEWVAFKRMLERSDPDFMN